MTTADKAPTISAAILTLISAGTSPREAFDAVLGTGAYDRLAGDVYDALRSPVGAR